MAGDPTSSDYLTDPIKSEQAKALMQRCLDDARVNYARLDRDRADWLGLLYYRGGVENHWTVWDKTTNSYVPRPYDGDSGAALPDWVPRAATNVFAKKIDGIVSILDQTNPAQEWRPATDDDADQAAAEVIRDAMPVLYEEVNYPVLRSQIHKFVALMDKVAVHVYYDNDAGYGTATLQMLRCPACGTMAMPAEAEEAGGCVAEACGAATFDEMEPAVDQFFQPMGPERPRGKICLRLIPSFEFSVPRSARVADEREMPWVLLHTRYGVEEARKCWPNARHLIGDGKQTSSRTTGGSGLQRQYADAMSKLTAPVASKILTSAGGAADPVGPVVYTLQHDATDEFPEGLYAVQLYDELVAAGPLPVKDDTGTPIKSILLRTFAHSPGSPYGKPPQDDLVPLQYWRNLIESLLALTLLHNAAPRTYVPMGVVLEDPITGQPGQTIRYRSLVPGDRPTTEPGHNPPEGLYKYLELIDQKFEELSGLNAVLMGNRPTGDPTLGEVQILQERGMAAFKTPLDVLVEFERRLSLLLLHIARQSAWSPRFRKIRGENGQWEVDQFAFTEIEGRADVYCEPASAWPRSPLMENLKLKEAVGMGVVQPALDPELAGKVLTKLDLAELKPSLDADRKQVARQLDRWRAAHVPEDIMRDPVQVGPWIGVQGLNVHILLKSAFLKSEEAEKLAMVNPPVYQTMQQHVQTIQQLLMLMTAPPPEAEPAKEEEPRPQPAGSEGDVLGQLVQGGVLQPQAEGPIAQGPSIDDIIKADLLRPVIEAPANGNGTPPQTMATPGGGY